MAKIRVLIVDDSVVIRGLLSEDLSTDPDIEVVGTASDGQIALAKIASLKPDLVILDIEMPVMDGMQTLREIRKNSATLPVIIFSYLTTSGTTTTIDALLLGANDYAAKPSSKSNNRQCVRDQLIPKIRALCRPESPKPRAIGSSGLSLEAKRRESGPAQIVAIGASTGGPNALVALLPMLTKAFPTPVVIVQHMPKEFTAALANRLAAISGFLVREGQSGELVRPGDMWVAPGGLHMEVRRSHDGVRLVTTEAPPENSCRPAADVLFRSVASAYGSGALAVVLTGMGQDGMRGCEAIREAGGRVLVQDEDSSVVWGMPGAVVRAGLADKVLPLDQLAKEINRMTGRSLPQTNSAKEVAPIPLAVNA
jgi:two-component system chemotaxis response regulator CheB